MTPQKYLVGNILLGGATGQKVVTSHSEVRTLFFHARSTRPNGIFYISPQPLCFVLL